MTWEIKRGDIGAGMRPMMVTARMTEPIVYSNDCIHLDGIIAAAWVRDLSERDRRRLPPVQGAEWASDFSLPLARWILPVQDPDAHTRQLCMRRYRGGHNGDSPHLWGWCASAESAKTNGHRCWRNRYRRRIFMANLTYYILRT